MWRWDGPERPSGDGSGVTGNGCDTALAGSWNEAEPICFHLWRDQCPYWIPGRSGCGSAFSGTSDSTGLSGPGGWREGGSSNRCCHTEPASQIPPTHVHGDLFEAGSVLGDGSSEDPRCQ